MTKKNNSVHSKNNKKNKIVFRNNFIKIIIFAALLAVVMFLLFPNLFKKNEPDREYMFRKDGELTITDNLNSVKAKLNIQIADTDFDRQLGLMFRKSMENNRGMLFIFPFETIQSFWMRNTLIPLDMIFINSDKKIVSISKNTKTLSDQSYTSAQPAQYVLEVNAGYSDKYNIKTGDKINWKRLK